MPTRHLKVVHPSDDKGSIFPTDINSSPTDLSALLNAIALHDLSKQGPALFQFMKTLQSWHDWQKYMEYNEIRRSTSEIEKHFAQVSAGEEAAPLDWQEKYIDRLANDIQDIKSSLHSTEERIEASINRMLEELRDRDNQRHKELLAVNERIDKNVSDLANEIRSTNERIDKNVSDLRNEIQSTNRWIIALVITTIAAIAGMVFTVIFR